LTFNYTITKDLVQSFLIVKIKRSSDLRKMGWLAELRQSQPNERILGFRLLI